VTSVTSLSDQAFSSLFHEFEHTAFRLETLQQYSVEYEEAPFRAFRAGEERRSDPAYADWVETIKSNRSAGKRMSRVHVIREPLSEYVRYELTWPYPDNVAAGEDIRILAVTGDTWPADLPRQDYWLFDSRHAAIMRYDEDGGFVEADLVEEPELIVQFNYARDVAIHLSVPYAEYMARLDART
jgi:hypothetical protein